MESPSLQSSPRTTASSNSSTSTSSHSGGGAAAPPPPVTPKTIPTCRSDANNPYPTTFVQADPSSFKQVVQMLTGSTTTAAAAKHHHHHHHHSSSAAASLETPSSRNPIPPAKKPVFKLYERRHNNFRNLKIINPLLPGGFLASGGFSARKQPEILSPSMLDFPSLVLSPVTPLIPDPFNRPNSGGGGGVSAEDRAIAEKRFYLHPSPRTTQDPPRLLPLFPVTSPRVSSAASPLPPPAAAAATSA